MTVIVVRTLFPEQILIINQVDQLDHIYIGFLLTIFKIIDTLIVVKPLSMI